MTPDWIGVLHETWTQAQSLGMVGRGPLEPHLTHAEGLAEIVGHVHGRALDLGTGAGLPGLVLAAHFPDTPWVLLDAAARRVALVDGALDRLGWRPRVRTVHERAETVARDPAHRASYDIVVARSFGPPAVTAECGAAFLTPTGRLLITEPPETDPARWSADGLARLGLTLGPRHEWPVHVQELHRSGPLPDAVPRRPGIPAKRPRWT